LDNYDRSQIDYSVEIKKIIEQYEEEKKILLE